MGGAEAAGAAGGAGFSGGGGTMVGRGAGGGDATGAGGAGAAGLGAGGTIVGLGATGGGAGLGGGGAAAASFFCVIALNTSPGREICDRSILVLISSSPRRGRAVRADELCASAEPRMRARTFSASCSSSELECVFFSVTPTCGSASRMALLFTSSSLARSLIRTLLIRPFFSPRCARSSSQPHGVSVLDSHANELEYACHVTQFFLEPRPRQAQPHLHWIRILLRRAQLAHPRLRPVPLPERLLPGQPQPEPRLPRPVPGSRSNY